jgi:soluble lytic murein transglycosylase-like protein
LALILLYIRHMMITHSKKLHLMALKVLGIGFIYAVSFFYGHHMYDAKSDSTDLLMVKYAAEISEAADIYNLNPAFIAAVIHAESNFKPFARSQVGAQGLMQVMPSTMRILGYRNGFDPRQNILAGSKYLRELLNDFNGNLLYTIAAYNAGPNAVKRFDGIPPYKETRGYVKKVLAHFKQYQKIFASDPMMS